MRRALGTLLLLLILAGGSWYAYREYATAPSAEPATERRRGPGGRRGGGGPEGPVAVLAAPVRRADVPVTLDAVGTAQALNTVTVRSQVEGRLVELAFREGQEVRRGDVLARIDPTIYQAQYDQALAKKAQDEANLANARLDLGRYQSLAATNYGSKQQADTQRAAVAQLEAQLKADQGAIDNARAYLDYTTITAPIDGRTGIRLVDAGNLVRAGDLTGLVVIAQLRPLTVLFNLPQQNLRAVNAAFARGAVEVEAIDSDTRAVVDRGQLAVVDNLVDPTTGTVKLKATFPNAELQLWPGSFVNVRLTVDVLRDVVVVPTGAVQRGPTGPFVYGLADDKAALKPVTVGRQDEVLSVITTGVAPPEQVITSGFARLTDGDAVRVAEPVVLEPAPAAARPRRRPLEGEAAAPRERRRRPDTGADATTAAVGRADGAERPARPAEASRPAGGGGAGPPDAAGPQAP